MAKVRNDQRIGATKSEYKPIAFWGVMIFVLVFFFVAPFYKGLFNGGQIIFEGPIYSAVMWSAGALLAAAIYLFPRWKLESHRDLMSLLIWIIPLFYFISMFNAASRHLAVNELYIHITCVVFFLIGAYFTENKWGEMIVQYALVGSGYVIVIHGFLNWFGNVHYQDAVLGMRLSGVFQYPNSYATYLTGLLIACLILMSNSRKWYKTIGHGIMLVPIVLSILLTLSRGGLLILPIIILIYLIFLSWKNQLISLVYLIISGSASLALFNYITAVRKQLNEGFKASISAQGWIWFLVMTIAVSTIIYVIQRYLAKSFTYKNVSQRMFRTSNFWIPAGLVVAGIILGTLLFGNSVLTNILPAEIQQRIESLNLENKSIASRIVFIEDSIKIAKDYPIFGAGGGAWSSLYNRYKSFFYTSNQTHTMLLQYLVETGFVGLGIIVLLVLYIFVMYLRGLNRVTGEVPKTFMLIAPFMGVAIIGHSMIDFDMSFVYLSAIAFLGLGTMTSRASLFKLSAENSFTKTLTGRIISSTVVCIAIVFFFFSAQSLRADNNFSKAMQAATATHNYNDIIGPLDSSLKLSPKNPDYTLFKTQILMQLYDQTKEDQFIKEAEQLLRGLQKSEPNNRQMIDQLYELLIRQGEYEQALNWVTFNLERLSWDIGLYEKSLSLFYELGKKAGTEGSSDQQLKIWNQAFELMDRFKDKQNESLKYNKKLRVSSGMVLPISQIYYMQGEYRKASDLLRTVRSTKFEIAINRATTRWYLASLKKQNRNDKNLYTKLVEEYPEEEAQIEYILSDKVQS